MNTMKSPTSSPRKPVTPDGKDESDAPGVPEGKGAQETPNEKSAAIVAAKKQCKLFKEAFSQPDVKVHFVGVW